MFNRRALSALGRQGLGKFTENKIQLNCRWTILGGGTDLEHGLADRVSHERNDDVKSADRLRNETRPSKSSTQTHFCVRYEIFMHNIFQAWNSVDMSIVFLITEKGDCL